MKPPIAKCIQYQHTLHGDVREDDFYWLKDKNNPEVIHYLEEENKYYETVMKPLEALTNELYKRMIDRVPISEENVPVKHGPYYYYTRYEKEMQYPIHARKRAEKRTQLPNTTEEIILDLNELAVEDEYLSVAALRLSSNHKRLAYLENRDGTDRYTLLIKDLNSGLLLRDTISDVYIYGSMEWSHCGNYIFYITVDENERPFQLWRHQLGTDTKNDELIYEETDETFTLFIQKSQSEKYIFIQSVSTTTSEVRMLSTETPLSTPQVIDERRDGILYYSEHWGDELLILTNENALNFKLLSCPIDQIHERKYVVPYDEERYLNGVYPFHDCLLITGRKDGLTQIWILQNGELEQLTWEEPVYTVSVLSNQSYKAEEVLIHYESSLTPETTYALDITSSTMTRLQVAPVSGEYNSSNYRQEQLWATAEDGVKVPLTVLYRKDALDKGPAPLILSGYGSYGANNDPYFSPYILPILDKGVVLVTAQVRGGSEMGRHWYEDGKMHNKRHTFTDFIAIANHLIDIGYTAPHKLAAQGGSAGGLLIGAVANMAGDLFEVMVPEVPFVDIVTTMLDTSLPLTTLEWNEWGNPNNKEEYFYMKSYSPYDNVEAKEYPHLYVTTGLNDPRVGYQEPAKWVARLRSLKTDNHDIVLKTNMGAGHFGSSGRFNALKEAAERYAFVLDKIC
ncbi:S9 family peptidase [Virgibacillus sp. MSJ-26]|uniref:S9 family peptidase n=1 Tax=Virgibacillus sp. MSJ-26 TaxID=2841522 RepID=UPI001C115132|nr:S9 family peptidase [Virgibacillus sp. MSJ-26]MBU5466175.1 S9 family peptidase [Virgibacillus sp. MSJ-26]